MLKVVFYSRVSTDKESRNPKLLTLDIELVLLYVPQRKRRKELYISTTIMPLKNKERQNLLTSEGVIFILIGLGTAKINN